MANIGIILLILLAIIIFTATLVLLITASVSSSTDQGSSNNGNTNIPQPCNQNVNISNLIQIPTTGFNCIQQGITGSLYYIGKLGQQQYDYVVAPWGTSPLDVCIGFCSSYLNGTCTGPIYNGVSAQENFNNCMSQLSSTTCTPPIPIAAQGTILYYAYSPTCNICDNCG